MTMSNQTDRDTDTQRRVIRALDQIARLPNIEREHVESVKEDVEQVVQGAENVRRKVEEAGGPGDWAVERLRGVLGD